MINLLIFSKDRACQLDLSFRSIFKNFLIPYDLTILYTYSSDSCKKGYDKLLSIYSDKFNFIKETNFKKDVLNCLDPKNKYFAVMPDDIIICDPITVTEEFDIFDKNHSIMALNFRMGPNLTEVCQSRPIEPQPEFISKNLWNWKKTTSRFWNYSMGMCQFHRTQDMIGYLPNIDFDSPTMYEGHMVIAPIENKPLMLCFDNSKVIEIAVNRVQQISKTNQFGNITTNELNGIWLSGKQIKLKSLCNLPKHINRFYHLDLEYETIGK